MISTSLLPGYRGKYKLVSPILLEEDIQELKEEFRLLSQKRDFLMQYLRPFLLGKIPMKMF